MHVCIYSHPDRGSDRYEEKSICAVSYYSVVTKCWMLSDSKSSLSVRKGNQNEKRRGVGGFYVGCCTREALLLPCLAVRSRISAYIVTHLCELLVSCGTATARATGCIWPNQGHRPVALLGCVLLEANPKRVKNNEPQHKLECTLKIQTSPSHKCIARATQPHLSANFAFCSPWAILEAKRVVDGEVI